MCRCYPAVYRAWAYIYISKYHLCQWECSQRWEQEASRLSLQATMAEFTDWRDRGALVGLLQAARRFPPRLLAQTHGGLFQRAQAGHCLSTTLGPLLSHTAGAEGPRREGRGDTASSALGRPCLHLLSEVTSNGPGAQRQLSLSLSPFCLVFQMHGHRSPATTQHHCPQRRPLQDTDCWEIAVTLQSAWVCWAASGAGFCTASRRSPLPPPRSA